MIATGKVTSAAALSRASSMSFRNGLASSPAPLNLQQNHLRSSYELMALSIKVSRIHAHLLRESNGTYWLIPKGRNPTLLRERELPREERTQVGPDEKIS